MSLAGIIGSGLQAGASSYGSAFDQALQVAEMRRRQEERARLLGQERAAQAANLSLYNRLNPAPPQFNEELVAGPPAPVPNPMLGPQRDQRASVLQALAGVTGSIGEAAGLNDGVPMAQGASPGVQQGLGMLQSLAPPEPPEQVAGANPTRLVDNPEYGQWRQERDDFGQMDPQSQSHFMAGAREFYEDQQATRGFEDAVRRVADSIRNHGFYHEADEWEKRSLESGTWDPGVSPKPAGLVEPGKLKQLRLLRQAGLGGDAATRASGFAPSLDPQVFEALQSADPETRAQGIAGFTAATGRPPPGSIVYRPPGGQQPITDPETLAAIEAKYGPEARQIAATTGRIMGRESAKLPSERAVEAVREMYGDDTAAVYAETGKVVRPKGGDAVDPEERAGKFAEIVKGYGGAAAFNPGAMTALEDKFIRGQKLTEGDWKRALVDGSSAHRGDTTAAKVVYEDFADKLRMARADANAAAKAKEGGDPALNARVKQLESLKAHALGEYIEKLKAADKKGEDLPSPEPAAPAPAPTGAPATAPNDENAVRARVRELLSQGKTREEIKSILQQEGAR